MALTKEITDDKIEVVGTYKALQVRTATVVKEDGTVLSKAFHRKVLYPGKLDNSNNYIKTDISGESADVQSVANAVWSQSIHDSFKTKLIQSKAELPGG